MTHSKVAGDLQLGDKRVTLNHLVASLRFFVSGLNSHLLWGPKSSAFFGGKFHHRGDLCL